MSSLKKKSPGQSHSKWSIGIICAGTLIALILIVSVSPIAFASGAPAVEWSQTYNGLHALSVIQTSDGSYAVAGASWSADATTFVKTDASGNTQWQKAQGNVVSVVQTSDSGYALFHDNSIVKTDGQGNIEAIINTEFNGVQEGILKRDGDYVLVGNSPGDNGEYFAWLQKLDAHGKILWNNTFTGGFTVYDVVETDDRGCALVGNWKNDFWLTRLDSNGNEQWSQFYTYGGLLDAHIAYSVAKTKDGGFVLAGTGEWQDSGGFIPWLIKVNSLGYFPLSVRYEQFPSESFDAVVQTDDEGYVLSLSQSAALLRTDSSGSELWRLALNSGGGYQSSCLIRSRDDGYVVAGTVFDTGFITKVSAEPDAQPPAVIVSSPQNKTYETTDIALAFTVNEPVSKISYTLDGQTEVTISGNTTLSGLSTGAHNLAVSAQDSAGLVGSSATIQFTVAARFPTDLVIAGIAVAAAVGIGFLAYVKRDNLSAYKKRGLTSFFQRHRLVAFANNRIVWTLTITSLTILLVFAQIFFPYFYHSISPGNSNSPFEVGVTYVYERDSPNLIYDEVTRIKNLGFDVIRANLVCDSKSPNAYSNAQTDVFFSAVEQFNIKVALIINNHDNIDNIDYYLEKWGQDLAYVQVLNEPDVASSWDMGALFTDDEAGSKFEQIYNTVDQYGLSAQYYTNFGPAFLVRTNLPIKFSEKLDFIGFDVFMDSFLTLSPRMIQLLQKITNKEVVISEFGMSTSDDTAQSDYIIRGLNLFKSMGLRGCWIVYWNSADNVYGIRGRLAEQEVGEWIAQNS